MFITCTVLAVQLGNTEATGQLVEHVNVIDSDRRLSTVSTGEDSGANGDRTIFHHAVMLGKDEPIRKLIKTLKIQHSIDDLQMLLDRRVVITSEAHNAPQVNEYYFDFLLHFV